jgi:site-specific recombinase XerD
VAATQYAYVKGSRDRAILAVLLGCGLRRRELIDLTLDHIQRREDHWAIVDLVGKGGHIRTVPMPDWVKQAIDHWLSVAEIAHGRIFRCVCRTGVVWGTKITEKVVWHVVKEYAESLGFQNSRHTISGDRALGSATIREASWNKSNFCSVMYLCRRPKNIWDASSDSGTS